MIVTCHHKVSAFSQHCSEMTCKNYSEKCPFHAISGTESATCNREGEPRFSVTYGDDGVVVQAFAGADDFGMPMLDLSMPEDDVHEFERELRCARLQWIGKREVTCSPIDVQQHDVIESLGMTVSDVLSAVNDTVVLQSRDGIEISLPANLEIVVVRAL
jgi:hypothetical protein